MRIGHYIAIQTPNGVEVMGVDGRQPGYYVLLNEETQQRLFYSHGDFYTEPPPGKRLEGYGSWIEIPSYLESHVYTNTLTEWADTKFNEGLFYREN